MLGIDERLDDYIYYNETGQEYNNDNENEDDNNGDDDDDSRSSLGLMKNDGKNACFQKPQYLTYLNNKYKYEYNEQQQQQNHDDDDGVTKYYKYD